MKQMTLKEFKQILKDADTPFESMGWEEILNEISGYQARLAEEMRRDGYPVASECTLW